MRILKRILSLLLIPLLLIPIDVYANMAEPKEPDVGSTITFEQNESISVISEVLDIRVNGAYADITATYKMQNVKDQNVTTKSMFISPNFEGNEVVVLVDGESADYQTATYNLNFPTHIGATDWQFEPSISTTGSGETVDTVTFEMTFEPLEEYEVAVSYRYELGGYPHQNDNYKIGKIEYYLTPAAMWQNFENLEINLYIDSDMPKITSSSLEFEKVGNRTYQYISDTLPEQNLEITIDQNALQTALGFLRNPYMWFFAALLAPFVLIAIVVILIILYIKKRNRKTDNK